MFAGIPSVAWKKFLNLRVTNNYSRGNIIFYESNLPLGVFFLCQGRVKIVKSNARERFHITRVIEAPNLVGDRAFFAQGMYAGTGEVMEDSRICFLQAQHFEDLFMKNAGVGRALLRRFAQEVGQAEERMLDLALRTIRERLAKYILERLAEHPQANGGGASISLSESRIELAEILGTSPEAVCRSLAEFRHKGLIKVEKRSIQVLNKNSLRLIANVSSRA
ncbi:MAG: Crp/Fnr family transcriptional regulator [Elusimicrobia bacterium]|nr:Crp/Fnr family transcriptional regulator [Elusimicrobiota bacterium]